ncbi:MAG TPA: NUDIX hydrolase [Polyangiaceae bacterium]|jgi:8-oxo-dGTP pyrophosphatase MutT (NUDIX family)
MRAWKVLNESLILERPWLRLRRQSIELPKGATLDEFYLIETGDWASVLAFTDQGEVIAVRQYRHGTGAVSLELPAGALDPHEAPLAAIQRELLEETGYKAREWKPLLSVAPEPTRHTNRAHFFFATGAYRAAEPKLEPSEDIEVVLLSPRALLEAVDGGNIVHGLHVAAILTAARRGML